MHYIHRYLQLEEIISKGVILGSIKYTFKHRLRTPNEAFFHRNPKLLGLDRQIEQMNFRAFGIFSENLSINQIKFLNF